MEQRKIQFIQVAALLVGTTFGTLWWVPAIPSWQQLAAMLSHSYETYVSTIVDVFSSQDTWEHLECIATTKTVKSKDAATTKVIPEQFIGHTTVC
jgi:hypothetical protein